MNVENFWFFFAPIRWDFSPKRFRKGSPLADPIWPPCFPRSGSRRGGQMKWYTLRPPALSKSPPKDPAAPPPYYGGEGNIPNVLLSAVSPRKTKILWGELLVRTCRNIARSWSQVLEDSGRSSLDGYWGLRLHTHTHFDGFERFGASDNDFEVIFQWPSWPFLFTLLR